MPSEEMSQQEIVKKHQLAIAKSMNIGKEILDILANIPEWHIREWMYICALDGMPGEQIQKMLDGGANVGHIKKARMDHLRDLCAGTDLLQKNIESLEREVKEACRENKKVRSAIENGLEDALKKQAEAQKETIRVKDELIEMLKKEVEGLKKKLETEKEIQRERPDSLDRQEVREKPADGEMKETMRDGHPGKEKRRTGLFASFRRNAETKRFIGQVMQNRDLDTEQQEFLLGCLEEGMSVKEMEAIAVPGLSVEMMRRLQRLQEKN